MAVNISSAGGVAAQFLTNTGAVLTGGKLFTYAAGTTTPVATYTTISGATAHTNPIVLDAAGRVPGGEIWLTDGVSYKFVLKDSTDVLIATYDNITGIGNVFLTTLAASTGSSLIGYLPAGTGAVATTVQAKLRQYVSVKDFGAVGNGVADDTVAFQAALNYVAKSAVRGNLYVPSGVYKLTDTLVVRNASPAVTYGNWSLTGDGRSSILYQTGAGKNVLEIGSSVSGLTTPDIMEGVSLHDLALVGTSGSNYGLYLNSVARCDFSNLYITADEADIYASGCLINSWSGIKCSYAPFNENPTPGIVIPTTRKYGLYVDNNNQAYTTNVFNELVLEGHSIYGMYCESGSTNTYNNLVCEGQIGAGVFSQSEWDVFNGIYVEAITGTALTLQNTQKVSIISLFTNIESVVLSNCIATVINSRANWTIGQSGGGITFINSDGTLTYLAGSNNGTDLRLINSTLFDITHKVQLGGGFGMAGGDTSSFSAVAPRALVDRVSYTQTPSVLASYGDKVWFSQGNINGNLGAKPGGYAGLIVSNRVETTAASIVAAGATAVVVTSATGMRVGDVLAVNVTSNTYEFSPISSIVGTTINLTGTIPTGAASGAAVFAIRWDLFGETAGFDALNSVSATPTVGSGGRNFTLADTGFNITNFTDGLIGQEIRLFPNFSGTITNGASIQLAGGANFVMAAGDSLTLIKKPDGVWYEVCRSVN